MALSVAEMVNSCKEMKRLAKVAIDGNRFADASHYMGEAQEWLRRIQDAMEATA